jgi:sporulation protein YlmC with PRC-barrel domain
MTRFLTTTALGLLLGLGTAVAQQAPMDESASPPAAMPEQPADPPAMQSEPSGPSDISPDIAPEAPQAEAPQATESEESDASDAIKSGSAQFLTEQEADDWLASDLIGKSVVNAENESIGTINDLVTDSNGEIAAVLIGVGGFLGLGEKDVAVSFKELKLARDEDDAVTAMVSTSKDALAQAPDFKTLDDQEVVQGSAKDDREGGAGGN